MITLHEGGGVRVKIPLLIEKGKNRLPSFVEQIGIYAKKKRAFLSLKLAKKLLTNPQTMPLSGI